MKPILLSLLLFVSFARATDPDPEAPNEVEMLRKQLVADEDRIARLETLTSLLMAAYQNDIKTKALERQPSPPSDVQEVIRP